MSTTVTDWTGKEEKSQSNKKETKVRFLPPPIIRDEDNDVEDELRMSPIDDQGDDNYGMVESVDPPEPPQEEILQWAEEMPEFKGGTEGLTDYLKANVKYPNVAKDQGIQGTVYVGFVVYKNGTLGNVKIRRGVHLVLDNEAKRVIKSMPNWIPAKQNGKTVNCDMTLPIKFKLEE